MQAYEIVPPVPLSPWVVFGLQFCIALLAMICTVGAVAELVRMFQRWREERNDATLPGRY